MKKRLNALEELVLFGKQNLHCFRHHFLLLLLYGSNNFRGKELSQLRIGFGQADVHEIGKAQDISLVFSVVPDDLGAVQLN